MNMNMKNIKFLSLIFMLALAMTSCEDVLNKKNLESLVADNLWQDPSLVKGFMDDVMKNNLPGNGVQDRTYDEWHYYISPASDESYHLYSGLGIAYDNVPISVPSDLNNGAVSIDRWHYPGIRNINKFLEGVNLCEKLSESDRNDYKAQMLVLRAWLYFDMVRMYGGVPLILHEQGLDEDLYVTRNKTSECIAQIIKDLDDAIAFGADFPMKRDDDNAARLNKAIALALKGRILLYYASPQFSKETPAGTKSAATRWQEAYTANQTAIRELTAAGYGLFRPKPANAAEAIQNYYEMYDENNEIPNNPEMIWVKRYQWPVSTSNVSDWATWPGTTVDFMNAFSKADGTPYTDLVIAPGTVTTNNTPFWLNREPRFYAFIGYNGCKWPRYETLPAGVTDLDSEGRLLHRWHFVNAPAPYNNCNRDDNLSGISRKMFDGEHINNTTTYGNRSGRDLPLLRYAELLLNFAECAAKTNHEPEAIQVLNDIRQRAGIPAANNHGLGTPTGDALILAIIQERQIELAYENFRYYDLRRWRLYTDNINGFTVKGTLRHGFKPQIKLSFDSPEELAILHETLKNIDMDNNPSSYFAVFDNQIRVMDSQGISFSERQYFYRLPYEERIKKNPKLEQTILWDNGTFNPYE
jgi:hypothetical protein